MRSLALFRFVAISILFVANTAQAAEWGRLTGRFVVDGVVPARANIVQDAVRVVNLVDESIVVDRIGGLRNVVIYLRTKNVNIAPRYAGAANEEVVLDIKNFRFDPHVVSLRTSQTLKVTNSDGVNHSLKFDLSLNPLWNHFLAFGATESRKLTSEEALPVRVGDTIHPWLKAWILVRNSPYAAISAADGKFVIHDLPTGAELEFQLWQERVGFLKMVAFQGGATDGKGRLRIAIKPGENDLGDIVVPTAVLK